MQIRDWMSPDPLTVRRGAALEDALQLISERGIRHLPVVDARGELVGMLSDRDIIGAPRGDDDREALTIGAVMSHPVHTVGSDATIAEAARTMLSRRINSVPVVDDGKLVGLVTSSDCLLALLESEHHTGDEVQRPPDNVVSELAVLDVDRCMQLLATQRVGRLGFIRDEHPEVLPLNYRWHSGSIVMRIGYGSLLEAVHRQEVAFEVDGASADAGRWSVMVRGQAEEVWQAEEISQLDTLGMRPWAPGHRDHYVRITPQRITGRMLA